jgi:hypothetical protein
LLPAAFCALGLKTIFDVEQNFNSLHAQRESAEAYIASQREAGWVALERHYDDGGFSGASIDRPALKRLLEEIETGGIDAVIVWPMACGSFRSAPMSLGCSAIFRSWEPKRFRSQWSSTTRPSIRPSHGTASSSPRPIGLFFRASTTKASSKKWLESASCSDP